MSAECLKAECSGDSLVPADIKERQTPALWHFLCRGDVDISKVCQKLTPFDV